MTAEPEARTFRDYRRSAENLRGATRRSLPAQNVGEAAASQQVSFLRTALLDWLSRAHKMLNIWQQTFTNISRRRIRREEIATFVERIERLNHDVDEFLYSDDSLLAQLGYADEASIWKAELAEIFESLMEAVDPYNNAMAEINNSYRDDPAKVVAFEKIAYMHSKEIRQRFARYKSDLDRQIKAIQSLMDQGK